MMKKRIFALFCALLMLTGLVSIAGAESTASTLPIYRTGGNYRHDSRDERNGREVYVPRVGA